MTSQIQYAVEAAMNRERILYLLAMQYHHVTESHDRRRCSVFNVNGIALPSTATERKVCKDNAQKVMARILARADSHKIARGRVVEAVVRNATAYERMGWEAFGKSQDWKEIVEGPDFIGGRNGE